MLFSTKDFVKQDIEVGSFSINILEHNIITNDYGSWVCELGNVQQFDKPTKVCLNCYENIISGNCMNYIFYLITLHLLKN